MRELFIYYRIHSNQAARARAILESMHAALRGRHPGLSARWLCREDEAPAGLTQTWMETYAVDSMHQPAGVSADLQADIEAEARALLGLIDGERHTEVFSACAS